MFNYNVHSIELHKVNIHEPINISPCDGAVGYNYEDTHKVILPSGVWHVKDGPWGAAHNEYLAFLLAKELELPVPETVIYMLPENLLYNNNTRLVRGKTFYSAQRYINAELAKYFDYSSLSEDNMEKLVRQIAKMDIFDYLIGNNDRHDKNFMIGREGRLYMIDNGWGGIGHEKMNFHCNHCSPDWIFKKPCYLEESMAYQKNLLDLLTKEKIKEISSLMKEFDWKTWNCHYAKSYKICLPPVEETIDEFFMIILRRMEEMSKSPCVPFPLNKT